MKVIYRSASKHIVSHESLKPAKNTNEAEQPLEPTPSNRFPLGVSVKPNSVVNGGQVRAVVLCSQSGIPFLILNVPELLLCVIAVGLQLNHPTQLTHFVLQLPISGKSLG